MQIKFLMTLLWVVTVWLSSVTEASVERDDCDGLFSPFSISIFGLQ